MTKREKIFARFVHYPTGLPFREIGKILLRLGFEAIPTRGGHEKFKHPKFKADIIVPVHNGECKNFYKKEIAMTLKNKGSSGQSPEGVNLCFNGARTKCKRRRFHFAHRLLK